MLDLLILDHCKSSFCPKIHDILVCPILLQKDGTLVMTNVGRSFIGRYVFQHQINYFEPDILILFWILLYNVRGLTFWNLDVRKFFLLISNADSQVRFCLFLILDSGLLDLTRYLQICASPDNLPTTD